MQAIVSTVFLCDVAQIASGKTSDCDDRKFSVDLWSHHDQVCTYKHGVTLDYNRVFFFSEEFREGSLVNAFFQKIQRRITTEELEWSVGSMGIVSC